jgi:uncharacterized protein YggE
MLKSIVAALSLIAVLASNPVQAEEAKLARTVSISGHGEVRVVPDLAVISVGGPKCA